MRRKEPVNYWNLAVPANNKRKMKDSKKIDKYLDLSRKYETIFFTVLKVMER